MPGYAGVAMAALDFRFEHGAVYLPGLRLWLDARRPIGPEDQVFVSHAHSDHTAAHSRVLFSLPTQKLMRARVSGERAEQVLEFGRRYTASQLGLAGRDVRVTLLPAGHILGSAMIRIESGTASLLYTGDFKLRPGLSAEPCEPCAADVLIMETTYGRPAYVFPPTEEILERIVHFCVDSLDNDETPVLLGYSLGKSQEILSGLAGAGLPIALSEPAAKLTAVYESLGRRFPAHEVLDLDRATGRVVLAPPGMAVSRLRRRLGRCRVAVLTGWAVDPGCRFLHQADAAFPLSDHADFPDLVAFVHRVRPQSVFTLHGFAADFAGHLRTLGVPARALSETEQLELGLVGCGSGKARAVVASIVAGRAPSGAVPPSAAIADPGSFTAFAAACEDIRSTRAKSEKTHRLAAYLSSVPTDALASVTTWMSGGSLTAGGRPVSTGWSVLRQAITRAAGVSDQEFRAWYLRYSDTGDTAAALLEARTDGGGPPPSWQEVAALWNRLAETNVAAEKVDHLARAMARCRGTEVRYLTKILTGNLRIGLQEGLVEEALALAFRAEPSTVRAAHQLTGNLGEVAVLAREGRLESADLVPFRPVRVMLAFPEPTAAAIWSRAEGWPAAPGKPPEVWIEDKYDGIRCQLHRVGARAALYSRDLREITAAFPEVAEAALRLPQDLILDGELVAMESGRPRPFGALQRRLGRRERDLFLEAEVPVAFVAFDLLWASGVGWQRRPLAERRAALDGLAPALTPPFLIAPGRSAASVSDLDSAFEAARAAGNEGLMIKDPRSPYMPGRRGIAWIKFKRALATLDCVVVAAEYGHGRRNGLLSDYTFAVRDADTGTLRVLGKAYTGLNDAEIERLTERFLGRVLQRHGRRLEVAPEVVLEISFDAIHPSDRHDSGYALRFPRISRLRPDKSAADIDTLDTVRRLVGTATPR